MNEQIRIELNEKKTRYKKLHRKARSSAEVALKLKRNRTASKK